MFDLRVAEDVFVMLHFVFKLSTILRRCMTCSKAVVIHVTYSSYWENFWQLGLSIIIIIVITRVGILILATPR